MLLVIGKRSPKLKVKDTGNKVVQNTLATSLPYKWSHLHLCYTSSIFPRQNAWRDWRMETAK